MLSHRLVLYVGFKQLLQYGLKLINAFSIFLYLSYFVLFLTANALHVLLVIITAELFSSNTCAIPKTVGHVYLFNISSFPIHVALHNII